MINSIRTAGLLTRLILCFISFSLLTQGITFAADVQLPQDTRVYVTTKETLKQKGGRLSVGQAVEAEVWRDVVVNGRVVIAAGTPVVAHVDELKKRKIAGIKGKMTIGAYETTSVDGHTIPLNGGYNKAGKSRMALAVGLGVVVFLPLVLIPGKAAELPEGTVFDAFVDQNALVGVEDNARNRVISLGSVAPGFDAALLYERLEGVDKPQYFSFEITGPAGMPSSFVIDRINSKPVKAIEVETMFSRQDGDRTRVEAQAKIKPLVKKFAKGINTIEIASTGGGERVATEVVVNVEI